MSGDARLTQEERQWLGLVHQQVRSVRYGVIQIVVHNGRVVQIERTDKLRLDQIGSSRTDINLGPMEGI